MAIRRDDDLYMNLLNVLPTILPRAITWAETVAADVASRGFGLSEMGFSDARTVGVIHPENIRVLMVDHIPLPQDPDLRTAALQTGLLGPTMIGLTLGYSILICQGHMTRRLLSHECRHVFQYESAGSIAVFLPVYLASIAQVGYGDCPFEKDARTHELPDA